ncbi:MAG: transposase [Planctomycetes bacterium]|nr:transposase [Planctomycetota bacterium]
MTDYRRAKFEGGFYFFTVVTYKRRDFLCDNDARACLKTAWSSVRANRPFEVVAVCLLPDHLHCVWKLPDGDNDYSTRWALIKKRFTRDYLKKGGIEAAQSRSRINKRERGIWQRRFWEHRIKDAADLQRHVDYIHYNPVKHGLVKRMDNWPYSSYHRYIESGGFAKKYFKQLQKEYEEIFAGE